jgi:hypothetical protein
MPTMMEPPATKVDDNARSVEQITTAIEARQQTILAEEKAMTRNEGCIVKAKIAIGSELEALKEATKREKKSWISEAKLIGLNERVARRLMALARSEWADIGPNGSDLLERLPVDDHKLAKLAELNREQLEKVIKDHDLKHLDRKEVAALVRDLCDGEPPEEAKPQVKLMASVGRFTKKSVEGIENWKKTGLEPKARQEFLDALKAGIKEIKRALDDDPRESADQADHKEE